MFANQSEPVSVMAPGQSMAETSRTLVSGTYRAMQAKAMI